MVTIQQVLSLIDEVSTSFKLFGATDALREEAEGYIARLGKEIAEYHNCELGQARSLPRESDIGPKATTTYNALVVLMGLHRR